MKSFTLPGTDITSPNVVLGLMRIADKSDDQVRDLVRTAREEGIDFVDHADIYGPEIHACERRFAEAMRLTPSERDSLTIQTKTGIVPQGPYFDHSYEHITASVEGSLRALDTDRVDILLLHRPDALVEPEEVARAALFFATGIALLAGFLEHFARLDAVLREGRPEAVVQAYRERCETLGRRVMVYTHDAVVEGTAVDIASGGSLVLDTAGEVSAGDVVHLR